jgi:hypothetical protein
MNNEKHFHHQFFALAPNEIDDPIGIISDLCEWEPLFDVRERVFDLFMLAMASEDWRAETPRDKASRMFELKWLIRMVEVLYLLHDLQEKGELLKHIKTNK